MGSMQDRADGRPIMAIMQAGRPPGGLCRPSATWRTLLLDPGAFDWLLQLLHASRGQPALSALAAKARQLLVRGLAYALHVEPTWALLLCLHCVSQQLSFCAAFASPGSRWFLE